MGIIINEKEAEETPCTCYQLESGAQLCYTKGICGFLSDNQKQEFCKGTEIKPAPHQLEEHLVKFAELAHACSVKIQEKYHKGERLEPFLMCMKGDIK